MFQNPKLKKVAIQEGYEPEKKSNNEGDYNKYWKIITKKKLNASMLIVLFLNKEVGLTLLCAVEKVVATRGLGVPVDMKKKRNSVQQKRGVFCFTYSPSSIKNNHVSTAKK